MIMKFSGKASILVVQKPLVHIFSDLWASRLPFMIPQLPDPEKVLWCSDNDSWQGVPV